jgi:structural maintenance of chromosome 3 (chondroitin sulfate proteoglycan 6)
MEKEVEKLNGELQDHRVSLEKVQNQQSEDSRGIARQQKNTERYLAKKQMLMGRKDECNRSIRDLGVLPEEAFEKYTHEKLDRVCFLCVHRVGTTVLRTFISSSRSSTQSMKA